MVCYYYIALYAEAPEPLPAHMAMARSNIQTAKQSWP